MNDDPAPEDDSDEDESKEEESEFSVASACVVSFSFVDSASEILESSAFRRDWILSSRFADRVVSD